MTSSLSRCRQIFLSSISTRLRKSGADGRPEAVAPSSSFHTTDSPWHKLTPRALYGDPRLATERYQPKAIYITGNGCGYNDDRLIDGECIDLRRIEFLCSYLKEMPRAIADGAPVKSYFLGLLLDNFEWTDGYTRRFGIVHTNDRTQARSLKANERWHAEVIANKRLF